MSASVQSRRRSRKRFTSSATCRPRGPRMKGRAMPKALKPIAWMTAALFAFTGCGGSGGAPNPPSATLKLDGRDLAVEPYTYCWETRGFFGGSGGCADGVPNHGPPVASTVRGTTARIEFDIDEPPEAFSVSATEGAPYVGQEGAPDVDQPVELRASEDLAFELDVAPGDWYVAIHATWPQGDAAFVIPLTVEAP